MTGGFTYAGQPFGLTVSARNAGGSATQNYAGSFARNVTLIARDAADTISNPGPGALPCPRSVTAATFNQGVASATPGICLYQRADGADKCTPACHGIRSEFADRPQRRGGDRP